MEIENKKLLGFDLDVFSVVDFKEYYTNNISKFSYSGLCAFLKASYIPAKYFLEQPEDTQETLILNKHNLLTDNSSKFNKFSIVCVYSEGMIVNAARVEYDKLDNTFNFLTELEGVENKLVGRFFTNDGYLNIFIYNKDTKLSKINYTNGVFIDVPLLLNKKTLVHFGSIRLCSDSDKVDVNKVVYNSTSSVDFEDCTCLISLIEEKLTDASQQGSNYENFNKSDDTYELEKSLLKLLSDKVITESMYKRTLEYLTKEGFQDTGITPVKLLKCMQDFDNNTRTVKEATNLRGLYNYLALYKLDGEPTKKEKNKCLIA